MAIDKSLRNYFQCGQRGPTYVNCTIGSFVCTTCSGLLRGLNPAHRIKSVGLSKVKITKISKYNKFIIKFTLQEVERIEKNGNSVVESSWMGSYDDRSGKKVSKDSPLFKKFLEDKYERKCWFIPYTKPKIRLGSFFYFLKEKPEIRVDQFYNRIRKSKNKKPPAENISSPAPALISIPRKPPSRTNSMR